MAPKQATLGRFFAKANGDSSSAPKQQTKLAFSTKPKNKKIKSEDAEQDKNRVKTKPKKAERANGRKDTSGSETETKKRRRASKAKALEKAAEVEEPEYDDGDDDSDEPVAKRPRKLRRREALEDSDEVTEDVEAEPAIKKEDARQSSRRSRSPRAKEKTKRSPSREEKKRTEAEESSSTSTEGEVEGKASKKSASSKKSLKAAQRTLLANTPDPYPDWKPGQPVPYAALCTTFCLIENTTKKLTMQEHSAKFLRQVMRLNPEDLLPTILLMINKLAPEYAGIELGIGESLIMKAIGESTGRSLDVIKADQKEIGDLGLVAAKSKSTQRTLLKPEPLKVRNVHSALMEIATISGTGAQGKKIDLIKKILSSSDANMKGKVDITKDKGGPSEAKYLVRFLEGKLRLGFAQQTAITSLAQAVVAHEAEKKGKPASSSDVEKAEALLKEVYSELPSYDSIIPAMLEHGIMNLREHCHLRPGVPLKPMLAKPTKAITEVLDRFEGQAFTCEYKYDGERTQIHYVTKDSSKKLGQTPASVSTGKGLAAIFSRNSEDMSPKYPDVLAKLGKWVKEGIKSFVLDCETVAWDPAEKKVLPFQQLMTRKKKDVKIEDVKVPVCVFAFDLLYLNGQAVVQKTLKERRELLYQSFAPVAGEFAFVESLNSKELDDIQHFLDESVKASCEGLMVKMLEGPESRYEPSKRSVNWLKVKKDYIAGVGDSLDLVVLGAYHGKGKRTSVYGSFLLACYNPGSDTYETACNVGTGFSEAILEELHEQLSDIVIDKPKPFYSHSSVSQHQPDVWFEPKFVWEVRAADLTPSPRYKAGCKERVDATGEGRGISLRFPRFIKIRDDKKCDEATSSRQVAEMYRKQESATKKKGPSVDDDFEY